MVHIIWTSSFSSRDQQSFEYYEEFPINLLSNFTQHSGVEVSEVIVVLLEYGANFSGPGKDIFRSDRATGEPSEAHQSNFLHPVFYYYKKLPSGKQFLCGSAIPEFQISLGVGVLKNT